MLAAALAMTIQGTFLTFSDPSDALPPPPKQLAEERTQLSRFDLVIEHGISPFLREDTIPEQLSALPQVRAAQRISPTQIGLRVERIDRLDRLGVEDVLRNQLSGGAPAPIPLIDVRRPGGESAVERLRAWRRSIESREHAPRLGMVSGRAERAQAVLALRTLRQTSLQNVARDAALQDVFDILDELVRLRAARGLRELQLPGAAGVFLEDGESGPVLQDFEVLGSPFSPVPAPAGPMKAERYALREVAVQLHAISSRTARLGGQQPATDLSRAYAILHRQVAKTLRIVEVAEPAVLVTNSSAFPPPAATSPFRR